MTNRGVRRRRDIYLLAICQALWVSASSLIITTTALVGSDLAPDKGLTTLPWALSFLSTMIVTYPASIFMGNYGRKTGFVVALSMGIFGAGLSAYALLCHSFQLFCLGALLIGILNGFAIYYRFAAAEIANENQRSRAISYVLAGGVVAAFIGPNLADKTRLIILDIPFAGGYLSLIVLYAISIGIVLLIRFPKPEPRTQPVAKPPLGALIKNPQIVAAILGACVSYGAMNLLMSATPLAMSACGYPFSDTAFVIQWHVLGMFAPSFVTGNLIERFGILSIMLTGAGILVLSIGVNLIGITVQHFWLALLLLGIGWNFLFIGATTLLAGACTDSNKSRVQGINDFITMSVVTCTAFWAGKLHDSIGWAALNISVLPFITMVVVGLIWMHLRSRKTPNQGAHNPTLWP